MPSPMSRREFVKASAIAGVPLVVAPSVIARTANVHGSDTVRIGLIGCGGRGTGAAVNALEGAPNTQIVALADAFKDRLDGCRGYLKGDDLKDFKDRITVTDDRCYTGFNAYKELLASGVDAVILATTPHFRPIHFEAAVREGKHVFMEKPVAVDPAGIRRVLAAGEEAEKKGLSVVAGTQRRHERCYLDAIGRVRGGAIGRIVGGRCYWNQAGLWVFKRLPEWSDMEYQMRNWYYFTWLSGDHIVEQHVHNLDACNWVIGSHPVRCLGMGGRQSRTGPEYGHIYDHFAVEYEYPGGVFVTSMCRQADGCASRVEEFVVGTEGVLSTSSGRASISGKAPWTFKSDNPNPYVQEHTDLHAAIAGEKPINEARSVAEATLTAIMGRMSAYTGQEVTWEQALNSKEDWKPASLKSLTFSGSLEVPPVPMPGVTPLT